MLFQEKGINWNDYKDEFKRGTYFHRVLKLIKFSQMELDKLPEKHEAKTNPDLLVERHVVERLRIPRLTQMIDPVKILFGE